MNTKHLKTIWDIFQVVCMLIIWFFVVRCIVKHEWQEGLFWLGMLGLDRLGKIRDEL